jgi:hypothetical protein
MDKMEPEMVDSFPEKFFAVLIPPSLKKYTM